MESFRESFEETDRDLILFTFHTSSRKFYCVFKVMFLNEYGYLVVTTNPEVSKHLPKVI